jgi:hypothetical protein
LVLEGFDATRLQKAVSLGTLRQHRLGAADRDTRLDKRRLVIPDKLVELSVAGGMTSNASAERCLRLGRVEGLPRGDQLPVTGRTGDCPE